MEDFFFRLDMFPKRVHLYLPSGKDKYQTASGVCLSFLLIILLSCYFIYAITFETEEEQAVINVTQGAAAASTFFATVSTTPVMPQIIPFNVAAPARPPAAPVTATATT